MHNYLQKCSILVWQVDFTYFLALLGCHVCLFVPDICPVWPPEVTPGWKRHICKENGWERRRRGQKSGKFAVSEVCIFEMCDPVSHPSGIVVPWYALTCPAGSPEEAPGCKMSIFQPKIGSKLEEVTYTAYKCEGGQCRGGGVGDNCLWAPGWPLIWLNWDPTSNKYFFAHILSYLLIPDTLGKYWGGGVEGWKTRKSRNLTFSSISLIWRIAW